MTSRTRTYCPDAAGLPRIGAQAQQRDGANQAVRLPRDLRFPEEVKEVRIRRQGDSLVISPIRSDWASFFSLQVDVPEDSPERRDGSPPQSREPL